MSTDRNNLAYWFPILQKTGVPVPRTEIITTELDLVPLCDGVPVDGLDGLVADLHEAAVQVGGFPIFLRTGYGSGKHDWLDTCYVATPEALPRHIGRLVEWSNIVDIFGLPTQTWVVREFLKLNANFPAFNGMPVAREFRVFIRDGRLECRHPYWPPGALDGRVHDEPQWEHLLARMNEPGVGDLAVIWGMAEQVAQGFDGYWSVDIAQKLDKEWVVTDMAVGEESYHWPDCPHSPMKDSVEMSPSEFATAIDVEEEDAE